MASNCGQEEKLNSGGQKGRTFCLERSPNTALRARRRTQCFLLGARRTGFPPSSTTNSQYGLGTLMCLSFPICKMNMTMATSRAVVRIKFKGVCFVNCKEKCTGEVDYYLETSLQQTSLLCYAKCWTHKVPCFVFKECHQFGGFFFFFFGQARILVPRPGIEPRPSAVKTPSPNQWTTREFRWGLFFF